MMFRRWPFYLLIVGLAILLVLIGKIYQFISEANQQIEPLEAPAEFHSTEPDLKSAQIGVENPVERGLLATGIIESASDTTHIGAPYRSLVSEVNVQVGDRVGKNQSLFKLDDRKLQGQLLVQEANVRLVTETADRIREDLKRLKNLKSTKTASDGDIHMREHDLSVALAQVDVAKAQVEQTKQLIERLIVRAPKSGIIFESSVRAGQYVSADSDSPAMVLGDLDKLQLRVFVNESDASSVKPNSKAVAYLGDNTKQSIPLRFIRIDPYVMTKGENRVEQIIYGFDKPKAFSVYVGQQLTVRIR